MAGVDKRGGELAGAGTEVGDGAAAVDKLQHRGRITGTHVVVCVGAAAERPCGLTAVGGVGEVRGVLGGRLPEGGGEGHAK